MTHSDPGASDHARPGTERLLAGVRAEQAQAVTYGSGRCCCSPSRRGQDPDAHPPCGVPARERPGAAMADPRRDVQRPRGWRAAPVPARGGSARRARRPRRHRGDASQINALYDRFGPRPTMGFADPSGWKCRPWGFADPSGWKCSARYCDAWGRGPGGAGL